jgi:hypothetical protein
MKKRLAAGAFFSLTLFYASADFRLENNRPEWVEAATSYAVSNLKKILAIPDTEEISVFFETNSDETMLERHAEFDFLYNLQFEFGAMTSSTFGEGTTEKHTIVRLPPVWVETIHKSQDGEKTLLQILHTPTAGYAVRKTDGTLALPELGRLWTKLAFYEAHPQFAETIKKVAEYTAPFSKRGETIYTYVAIYSYNKAAFKNEFTEMRKKLQ